MSAHEAAAAGDALLHGARSTCSSSY